MKEADEKIVDEVINSINNPDMDDELISGNYKKIEDVNILEKLYNNILAIRK